MPSADREYPTYPEPCFYFSHLTFHHKKSRLIRWQLSQSDQLYETDPIVSSGEEDRRSSGRPAPVSQVFRVRAGDKWSRFKNCKYIQISFRAVKQLFVNGDE